MAASDKSGAVSFDTEDFSSDSDGWQELIRSEYGKVIFSDLLCNADAGTVECKFQITDNVHEDPNDYVGLFRVGYLDISQCLVSKMLSQTKCEDDGKLQRCVFTENELPYLDDSYYQFLYVTRDQEICGASMPFQIKMSSFKSKESSAESGSSEKMESGFLIVNELERKRSEESIEQEKAPFQQSPLSDQKKEEIADWVSQNPDYYSLVEQIKENAFTIDALQQSKDLAMKEVVNMVEISSKQKAEIAQLKNMLAAYEQKGKLSQCFQDEQQFEIRCLSKEVEELKKILEVWGCLQDTPEAKERNIENLIQKAQVFGKLINETIENLDYSYEDELEKFFQLKIQILIILSKMTKATNHANMCDREGFNKRIHSQLEKDMKKNYCIDSASGSNESAGSLLANSNSYTNEPKAKKIDSAASSSAEISSSPDTRVKEPINEVAPKEVAEQNTSVKKVFESATLQHLTIPLPRLEVIANKDTPVPLETDLTLSAEDISIIDRLTENMIKRKFNLFETIELVDDSSSDSGSDVSEISECSSSMKKDLLCLGRVLEAVSSSQSSLEQLVVVGNEEDKKLICSEEWDMLLKRCALHYQIEILLEHIEKQKEGMKKVSDKLCELFTKYMLLKDQCSEAKEGCKKMEEVLDLKNWDILDLHSSLKFKNSLILLYSEEKEELESKIDNSEASIQELRARLEAAHNIYKNQYREIRRLNKLLKKHNLSKHQTKTTKFGEFSLTSSDSSKKTSSFEMIPNKSVQNISDSDTGEHMFEDKSFFPNRKSYSDPDPFRDSKFVKPGRIGWGTVSKLMIQEDEEKYAQMIKDIEKTPPPPCKYCVQTTTDKPNTETHEDIKNIPFQAKLRCEQLAERITIVEPNTETQEGKPNQNVPVRITTDTPNTETQEGKSTLNLPVFANYDSYAHFQAVMKDYFGNWLKLSPSLNIPGCSISCYFCKKMFHMVNGNPSELMDHLFDEHSIWTCPVCGHLFENSIPHKYFSIHLNKHFDRK